MSKQAAVKKSLPSALEANERLYDALDRLLNGDATMIKDVWSHSDDTILADSSGGRQLGWDDISAQLDRQSQMQQSGRVDVADIQTIENDDLTVISCWERGHIRGRDGTEIAVAQRAVNVFRNEDGAWKLKLRQSDLSPQLQNLKWDPDSYSQESCDD